MIFFFNHVWLLQITHNDTTVYDVSGTRGCVRLAGWLAGWIAGWWLAACARQEREECAQLINADQTSQADRQACQWYRSVEMTHRHDLHVADVHAGSAAAAQPVLVAGSEVVAAYAQVGRHGHTAQRRQQSALRFTVTVRRAGLADIPQDEMGEHAALGRRELADVIYPNSAAVSLGCRQQQGLASQAGGSVQSSIHLRHDKHMLQQPANHMLQQPARRSPEALLLRVEGPHLQRDFLAHAGQLRCVLRHLHGSLQLGRVLQKVRLSQAEVQLETCFHCEV